MQITGQDFTKPAVNDEHGQCVHCGRDNSAKEDANRPCSDECPMYWEEIGIGHPDHAQVAA